MVVTGRSFHSLSYRFSGTVSVGWQDKTLISGPGSLTFMPKGFEYTTCNQEQGELIVVHFTCMEEYENLLPVVLTPEQPKTFENLFQSLVEVYHPGRERDYPCFSRLYHILSDFDNLLSASHNQRVPRRIQEVRQYIDRNFHLPISVPELASLACVSETYFRKEFKQYFGLTPVAYIQKIRIENAKSLLLTGCYQVSEVAIRCGFDSISYFSYVFHNRTGITPGEYMGLQRDVCKSSNR